LLSLLRYLLVSLLLHAILLAGLGEPLPSSEGNAQLPLHNNLRANLVRSGIGDEKWVPSVETFPQAAERQRKDSVSPDSAFTPDIGSPGTPDLPVQAGSAAAPVGKEVQEDLPSPEAIGEYRLNLARASRLFREYPALARERGWEGEVVVVVATVAGVGRPRVSLSRSSGFELLDTQALAMVDQAVGIAVLPSTLKWRQFALTLPIHFNLNVPKD